MDFELSEEQKLIQQTARDFATRELEPGAGKREREHIFPKAELKKMAELGLMGVNVGEKWGGVEAGVVAYSLAMMMAIQPIMYVSVGTGTPLGEAFYSFVPITPETMLTVASAAFAFAFAITLGVVCREIIRPNCSIPKLVYYAIMLAHPAVFYFVDTSFKYYFFTTYLWSHWFVAIGLVARINVNGYRASGKTTPRAQLRHWLTIGAIVGLVWWLIGGLDHLAVFSGRDYRQKLAEVTPEQSLFVGIVLGAFLAEQLVHYYCDRHLFRMRDPEIRQAIGPLL